MQKHFGWLGRLLKKLKPTFIKRPDWYIIKKFIGTYIYSIALIISISIVFDVNEHFGKVHQVSRTAELSGSTTTRTSSPLRQSVLAALSSSSPRIFFTSKLAGNSEIIATVGALEYRSSDSCDPT